MQNARSALVMSLLVLLVIFLARCINDPQKGQDTRGPEYAGAAVCVNCHRNISASFTHTNHYKTSSPVNGALLKKNTDTSMRYGYYRDSGYIRIEEMKDVFFQSLFINDKKITGRRYDMAFGSAEKAQTYAGWEGDQLFQLPLTYYSSMQVWANSPGFPANHAKFDRLIINGCFQCHATYIAKEDVPAGPMAVRDKFYPGTLIYGIDCERCHGPAAAHVKFQQENPAVKTAKYITSIRSLSRERQLDICATCHSGNDRSELRSIFSFVPGDTLSGFYLPEFGFGAMNVSQPDVHGKQMQLLGSSKCFQRSNMTCGSCHNPHEEESNRSRIFISKCMGCHQGSLHAAVFLKKIEQAAGNADIEKVSCITCHMPKQSSKVISFRDGTTEKTLPYYLTTHRIAVY